MKKLYHREWELFKKNYAKGFILVFLLSLVSTIGAYIFLLNRPEVAETIVEMLVGVMEEKGVSPELTRWDFFILLLTNNLRVAAITVALGVIPIIVLPLFSSIITTSSVGVILAVEQLDGGRPLVMLLTGIVPHGILELSAIYLSCSIGLFISLNLARKIFMGQDTGWTFKSLLFQAGRSFLLVVVPLIVLAAIIESTLTPMLLIKYYVG